MSDDGWTLAPSGWEYRATVDERGNRWVAQRRPTTDGRQHSYPIQTTGDLNVPPIDRELVRSLWEAKDA